MKPCDFCQRRAVRTFIVNDEPLRYSCGAYRHDELARELVQRDGHTEWTERITAPFYGDTMSYDVKKTGMSIESRLK